MATSASEKNRQSMLEKRRKEMMEDFERQKLQLAKESERNRTGSDRFVAKTETVEEILKNKTIGLKTLSDFQETRAELEEEKRREAAKTAELKTEEVKKRKKKKAARATLSFLDGDEDDEDASKDGEGVEDKPVLKKVKISKNPTVNTSFLPDREREESERKEREELRQKWLKMQEDAKQEDIEVTYSYWDGSGHRKNVTCKKGDTVAQFLEKARTQFPELRGISVDNLMYIKEDLIIPQDYTFYWFIINKARGKSGPLFNFDVHDDVRALADATVEKDESHAGKVVQRAWYERSKHIFPASRWEVFDPNKTYGSYSIHDRTKGQ